MITTAELHEMLLNAASRRAARDGVRFGSADAVVATGAPWAVGTSSTGHYNSSGAYVGYMLAGDLAGDKPVGP